jgi:hypothetical protein
VALRRIGYTRRLAARLLEPDGGINQPGQSMSGM